MYARVHPRSLGRPVDGHCPGPAAMRYSERTRAIALVGYAAQSPGCALYLVEPELYMGDVAVALEAARQLA